MLIIFGGNLKLFNTGTIMLIFNMENIEMIINLMDTMFQKKLQKGDYHSPFVVNWQASFRLIETDEWQMVSINLFTLYTPENSHGTRNLPNWKGK